MRLFNAFQLVLGFALFPFGIQWVKDATFYAHDMIFWVLCVSYVVSFGMMVYAVGERLYRERC